MKPFQHYTTNFFVFAASPIFMISCEGSKPRRMYNAGKYLYEDYEKTGDPTWLIIFIVALLAFGGFWLWNKSKRK